MTRRILIAVTHLLGAGHLTRAAALARAFARAGHETTLVSGGMPAPLISTEGARLVQIPPVRTRGVEFGTLLDEGGEPVTAQHLQARREALVATLAVARSEAVVTELFPFGRRILAAEFTALLDAARASRPRPLVLASIRDVLAPPSKPGRAMDVEERLQAYYDGVLVHADPALAPLEESWPVREAVRPFLHYTGYVDEGASVPKSVERRGVVVSGGSSAAALPMLRAACGAAHLLSDQQWLLLAGAGLSAAEFEGIRAQAPAGAFVERTRPDFRALLAGAALSVSQAGYNTTVDLLRAGPRALLVPFEGGRETEQALRAELLRRRGLAAVLPEAELSAGALAGAAARLLAGPLPGAPGVRLDGAAETVAAVEGMLEERHLLRPPRGPDSPRACARGRERGRPALATTSVLRLLPSDARAHPLTPPLPARFARSPLDEALRRAEDAGVSLDLWWRDDDAIAATTALERLLRLARSCRVPLALAVVPASVEPSLALRLAHAPDATVLTHGLSHVDHAPPGTKKAEFGPHRPLDAMAAELAEGCRQTALAFGARSLPVLVPPWNRIAPALVPTLPGLGYAGLSIFGPRGTKHPAPGLIQINTHLDPINWRDRRGLVDRERLHADLAEAVLARVAGKSDEPIGLLTHHLVHDEATWSFCESLWEHLARSPAVRYPFVDELFSRESLPRVTEP